MTRTIKKSLMLAVAVSAMAAMAVPSMASAANWGVPTVNNTLTGGSMGLLLVDGSAHYGLGCTGGGFGVRARNPASPTLDINTANSYTCTGSLLWSGCNATLTPTGLPWTADGTSTTNVTLNSVNYTVVITGTCSFKGTFVLQGALTGGVWNNTFGSRGVTYNSDSGLRLKLPAFGYDKPVTITTTLGATALTLS